MTEEKCRVCGKAPLSADEKALTRKLIDKDAAAFFCLSCMAEYLEAEEWELKEKIKEFRDKDCIFFR